MEDGRERLIGHEGGLVAIVRIAHINAVDSRFGMRRKSEAPDFESYFGGEASEACELAVLQALFQPCIFLYFLQRSMHSSKVLQYSEVFCLDRDWQGPPDALFDANLVLKTINFEVEELIAIKRLAVRPRCIDYLHLCDRIGLEEDTHAACWP